MNQLETNAVPWLGFYIKWAIVAYLPKFSLEKIDESIPPCDEVVYWLLRPKQPSAQLREIIAVAFYSPPKCREKTKLTDHIISTIHTLLTKYPRAGIWYCDRR